jgi:hypothetical protein
VRNVRDLQPALTACTRLPPGCTARRPRHVEGMRTPRFPSVASLAVGTLCILAAFPAEAADKNPFKLEYSVAEDAEGCPDESGLRAKVAARLGYDPFAANASRTIVTRIRKVGAKVTSRIELRDATGKLRGVRELEAGTCADLAASTSFAMAVAIDPEEAHAAKPEVAPPPVPVPAPVPAPSGPPPPPLRPEAPTATPKVPEAPPNVAWVPTISLGFYGAGLGPYATFSGGGTAGLWLEHGALGLGLEGRAAIPSSGVVGAGRVRTNIMGVSPAACARVSGAAFCAHVLLGALQGAAEGVEAPEKQSTFYSSIGLRASYRWYPVQGAGFALEPYVGSDLVLTRTRLNFRGQEVWSTSPMSVEPGLRAVHSFF